MAKHEFGIMEKTPVCGERYDTYEPERYDLLSVDDELIEPLLPKLCEIKFFWHSVDVDGKGLSYCGITLIPPESMEKMICVTKKDDRLDGLTELLTKAKKENKFVIHYGL